LLVIRSDLACTFSNSEDYGIRWRCQAIQIVPAAALWWGCVRRVVRVQIYCPRPWAQKTLDDRLIMQHLIC